MSSLPNNPPSPPPVAPPSAGAEPEYVPNYDDLITEDHKPVERILIEKQYRLLTNPLYTSWPGPGEGRSFLVLANVGWFYQEKTPAVAPDCLLSLDVICPEDLHTKRGHSYYQWRVGKPPDVIIEIVSDKLGGEESYKWNLYARQGVRYYAIYDPEHILSDETLRPFECCGGVFQPTATGPWPGIGLGLRLWRGEFEHHQDEWLRWCDAEGNIIPTAEEDKELAEQRTAQAEEEKEMAEQRAAQAKEEKEMAEQRAAQAKEDKEMAEQRAARAEEGRKSAEQRAAQAHELNRQLEEELRRLKGE